MTPRIVFNDKCLSNTDRVVLSLIVSLTLKKGYCYANNNYLASYINSSKRTIGNSLSKLKKLEYIEIKYTKTKRKIYLNNEKIPTKLSTGVAKKGSTDIAENCNHNINKRKNNKDNINYTNYYNNYKENVPNWIKNKELCNIVESNDNEKKEMEVILNEMY